MVARGANEAWSRRHQRCAAMLRRQPWGCHGVAMAGVGTAQHRHREGRARHDHGEDAYQHEQARAGTSKGEVCGIVGAGAVVVVRRLDAGSSG